MDIRLFGGGGAGSDLAEAGLEVHQVPQGGVEVEHDGMPYLQEQFGLSQAVLGVHDLLHGIADEAVGVFGVHRASFRIEGVLVRGLNLDKIKRPSSSGLRTA